MSRLQTSKLGLLDDLPNGLPTQENDLATHAIPPAAPHAAFHPDAFPAFAEPTGVDHVILCVRGGQYGRERFFIDVAKKLPQGTYGQVVPFTDGLNMRRALTTSSFAPYIFGRKPPFSSGRCILSLVEAPTAADFNIDSFKAISSLRFDFRCEILEHAFFPVLIVGERPNTRCKFGGGVIQPNGPALLLEQASGLGIETLAPRESNFEEDIRAGLLRILDAKNIVPREVL